MRVILCLFFIFNASLALAGPYCAKVFESSEIIEQIGATNVKYIDASYRPDTYHKDINVLKDALILLDKNGHFSLAVNGLEMNGRVVNRPIDLQQLNPEQHQSSIIIRLNGLTEKEKIELVENIKSLEGKRSLSCINAIEYVLAETLGIKSSANRIADSIHPSVEEFISSTWKREDGSLIEPVVYKHSPRTLSNIIGRIYTLGKILLYGKALTLPGWTQIVLDPSSLIQYHPETTSKKEIEAILPTEMNKVRGFRTIWNWLHSTLHNAGGAYQVVKYMTFKKMKHGLIPEDHPWITGISPHTGRSIYADNIVFSSPRAEKFITEPESDEGIVNRVASFMRAMTKKSTGVEEIPHGSKRRMPHVVNYLHGDVSFNGGHIIFNNFKDAMFYLSDPKFTKEIYRFVKETKREFLIILREREYNPAEYAVFLGFIRSHLKWYANANGPQARVLYGTPSPYPVINVINGNWINSMKALERGEFDKLILPPIQTDNYFQGPYAGDRDQYNFLEASLAYFNFLVLKNRGFQGGFVFTLRKNIEPRQYEDYLKAKERGEKPLMIAPVVNPYLFLKEQSKPEILEDL